MLMPIALPDLSDVVLAPLETETASNGFILKSATVRLAQPYYLAHGWTFSAR
jgi:hypothetical protein